MALAPATAVTVTVTVTPTITVYSTMLASPTTAAFASTAVAGATALSEVPAILNYADFVAVGGFVTFLSSLAQTFITPQNRYLGGFLLATNLLSAQGTGAALVAGQPTGLRIIILGAAASGISPIIGCSLVAGAGPGTPVPIYNTIIWFARGAFISEIDRALRRAHVLPPVAWYVKCLYLSDMDLTKNIQLLTELCLAIYAITTL